MAGLGMEALFSERMPNALKTGQCFFSGKLCVGVLWVRVKLECSCAIPGNF